MSLNVTLTDTVPTREAGKLRRFEPFEHPLPGSRRRRLALPERKGVGRHLAKEGEAARASNVGGQALDGLPGWVGQEFGREFLGWQQI